jgi:hypothetical protein
LRDKGADVQMATTDERVSFLEGRIMEQSNVFTGIRMLMASLDARMTRLEDAMDARFNRMETRLDQFERKFDLKLDQRFAWLIGLQLTTILAFVAAVVALVRQ